MLSDKEVLSYGSKLPNCEVCGDGFSCQQNINTTSETVYVSLQIMRQSIQTFRSMYCQGIDIWKEF